MDDIERERRVGVFEIDGRSGLGNVIEAATELVDAVQDERDEVADGAFGEEGVERCTPNSVKMMVDRSDGLVRGLVRIVDSVHDGVSMLTVRNGPKQSACLLGFSTGTPELLKTSS